MLSVYDMIANNFPSCHITSLEERAAEEEDEEEVEKHSSAALVPLTDLASAPALPGLLQMSEAGASPADLRAAQS